MTTDELKIYYANLLILQYRNKPRAYATIKNVVDPFIMDSLPLALQDAFDIETAVGAQLDILGKYAGVKRSVLTFSGTVILNDSDFRVLIKMKLVQNNSGSSLEDIQNLIHRFFNGSILVFDYQNMHMDYFFDSVLGSSDLAEAFVRQGLLPKPMGVQLGSLIYSATIHDFFGFRTYTVVPIDNSPFNSYADYHTDRPWLSYANAIAV